VKAHGIRGEVVVEAVSNRPERFATGSVLFAGERALVIGRASPQGGPAAGGRMPRTRWIVAFEGIPDRTRAETMRGTVLFGDPIAAPGMKTSCGSMSWSDQRSSIGPDGRSAG